MLTKLDQIVDVTRQRVSSRKGVADLPTLERRAAAHRPGGFRAALAARSAAGPAVIAELKKASPSKGIIRESFDVAALAREYAEGGATALSVLTEEQFFLGDLENLPVAAAASQLPCLRKDFTVDDFQLLEARAWHADAVLLLASVLGDEELARFHRRAIELELDVLCEVHDETELRRAVDLGFDLIGVNSRNLRTFEVSLDTAEKLAARIPAGVLKVAESGIHSAQDLRRLRHAGYDAFLVGESLMRAASPGQALRELIEESGN